MTDDDKNDLLRVRVAVLTASNNFLWYSEMEVLLRGKGLWESVKSDTASSESTDESTIARGKNIAWDYIL